jgi:hypothetical protein
LKTGPDFFLLSWTILYIWKMFLWFFSNLKWSVLGCPVPVKMNHSETRQVWFSDGYCTGLFTVSDIKWSNHFISGLVFEQLDSLNHFI